MKDLVDMLALFMLQVVKRDGNLYPTLLEFVLFATNHYATGM
jgi:hypothetical protein